MTATQHALYARVFDAYAELRAAGERQDLTFMGPVAGAALRTWAAARKLDVVPETLGDVADLGKTWTVLRATLEGDYFPSISVHLNDDISMVEAVVATEEPELECPF